jgi:hypothetical protein
MEDEVGGTCETNGVEEECLEVIGGKARSKEITRKTMSLMVVILRWILQKYD